MHIVVLFEKWVMVGKCKELKNKLILKDASVVRYWGTSKGLPELANSGPLSGTKLDGKAEMEFPMSSVIAKIKCKTSAWKSY